MTKSCELDSTRTIFSHSDRYARLRAVETRYVLARAQTFLTAPSKLYAKLWGPVLTQARYGERAESYKNSEQIVTFVIVLSELESKSNSCFCKHHRHHLKSGLQRSKERTMAMVTVGTNKTAELYIT